MESAVIYKPAKTPAQSGKAKTKAWVLEFCQKEPMRIDPLMGWAGSGDTENHLILFFDSEEEAVAFAKEKNLSYRLILSPSSQQTPKSYGENFQGLRERL